MNRPAVISSVATALATTGVCYLVFSPDRDGPARQQRPQRPRIEGTTLERIIDSATSPPARGSLDLARSRKDANESAAFAMLRLLATAQAQVQASGVIDRNANGVGEYGFFAELAGMADVAAAGRSPLLVTPPILAPSMGHVVGGRVVRAGYSFQVYLPGPNGSFEPEARDGGTTAGRTDAGQAEVLWCCYAWPMSRGESGDRAFFVNQSGDVLASGNATTRYSGTAKTPGPRAAFRGTDQTMGGEIAIDAAGVDGEVWRLVR